MFQAKTTSSTFNNTADDGNFVWLYYAVKRSVDIRFFIATIEFYNENVEKTIFSWSFNLSLKVSGPLPIFWHQRPQKKNHNNFCGAIKYILPIRNWHEIRSELLPLLINSENELRVKALFRNNFVVSYLMNFAPIIIVVMQMFFKHILCYIYGTESRIWLKIYHSLAGFVSRH